ncbi:MAG: MurR/RpiR family transcriptional regulator [Rhizobiaceae bacterium]
MNPPPSSSARSLESRIYAVYAQLPPAERKLADVMLQHQMDLALYTASELAREAGVSTATAARLIRSLGYVSYPAAKREIRESAHWGSPQGGAIDRSQEPVPSLAAVVQTNIDNIRATADSVSPQTLAAVVDASVRADRIVLIGMRNGFGLAHYAAHYFGLIKDDVRVLPATGSSMAHELSSIGPGDHVICFAFRRRPRTLPRMLSDLSAAGAVTTLITDISASDSAKAADHAIRCRCHSLAPFNSFTAAITIVDYLSCTVAALLGEKSVERFRRIDRMVDLLEDVATPKTETREKR